MKFSELTTKEEVAELIRWHNANSEYVVLDIETTGLNPFTDAITDIVLNGKSERAAAIFSANYLTELRKLEVPVIAHNFKFDFNFLFRNGIDLRKSGLFADTMLLDHLLDENEEHSLDAIVKRRYNDNYKEVFWAKADSFEAHTKEDRVEYACKDVIYTEQIYLDLMSDLDKSAIPFSLIDHVHSLALVLYDTEISGIKLDLDYLEEMAKNLAFQIQSYILEMSKIASNEITLIENEEYVNALSARKTDKGKAGVKKPVFNWDSSKQLNTLLYGKIKLPVQISKARKPTVDDAALQNLLYLHPIIACLREYRGLQKVYTSFIEGSLKKMREGRIHPSFNVNGTVTGRISSSSPNMQQLPKEGGVRGIYIPQSGNKLLSADYGQLEVALAAHFSRDTNLLRIVYEGISQHDITATGLGIDRGKAKTINFAMQYGAGISKIKAILGCSEKDAELALNKYWETYSGLAAFIKQCHLAVDEGRPLINPFGRQRHFPKTFEDKWARERAKRQAANSIIQGTGADITSWSLYTANRRLKDKNLGKALFSVHDELIIEVESSKVEEARDLVVNTMIESGTRINLTIPLTVSASKGTDRWEK